MKKFALISSILALIVCLWASTFKTRDNTYEGMNKAVVPVVSQKETTATDVTVTDSTGTNVDTGAQVGYYLIIDSYRTLGQAQLAAEKYVNGSGTDVIILPQTKEGYYRISYGRYSARDEAEAAIISVRKNINSDAWILSVRE